ncbi:UNVERIFIED_CONTAM: hypothetical protein Slati_3081000 [Sesamum latifolium]|uniref:Reverse transcriptase domain-containing protein n=1 Tax=Sesamum latifolium TaxID=2727402 RepID=A0AAW2UZL1_9LAMI
MIANDPLFQFHWKCAELGLFQLGFADDLLLFCAADRHSIALFQRGLALFASLSGLQEGILPVRYLGLPLFSSRAGTPLSFAARVQLIKSVLMALNTYWAMAFVLPKGLIREIEKRLRSFLWKGTMGSGHAKVAWTRVCTPVEEGGLGIRNMFALNMAMMARSYGLATATYDLFALGMAPGSLFGMIHGTTLGHSLFGFPWGRISRDSITWNAGSGRFTNDVAYELFQPRGPKIIIVFYVVVDMLKYTSTCSSIASTRIYVLIPFGAGYGLHGLIKIGRQGFVGPPRDGGQTCGSCGI